MIRHNYATKLKKRLPKNERTSYLCPGLEPSARTPAGLNLPPGLFWQGEGAAPFIWDSPCSLQIEHGALTASTLMTFELSNTTRLRGQDGIVLGLAQVLGNINHPNRQQAFNEAAQVVF